MASDSPARNEETLSYIVSVCHAAWMEERDSKCREKALAIEFWIAAVLVGGSFVAGVVGAVRALLGH